MRAKLFRGRDIIRISDTITCDTEVDFVFFVVASLLLQQDAEDFFKKWKDEHDGRRPFGNKPFEFPDFRAYVVNLFLSEPAFILFRIKYPRITRFMASWIEGKTLETIAEGLTEMGEQ